MLERRKQFGLRNAEQESAPAAPPDFERDRPMYERVRRHDARIDALLTEHEALLAHRSTDGVVDDDREKARIEEEIAAHYKAQH